MSTRTSARVIGTRSAHSVNMQSNTRATRVEDSTAVKEHQAPLISGTSEPVRSVFTVANLLLDTNSPGHTGQSSLGQESLLGDSRSTAPPDSSESGHRS